MPAPRMIALRCPDRVHVTPVDVEALAADVDCHGCGRALLAGIDAVLGEDGADE